MNASPVRLVILLYLALTAAIQLGGATPPPKPSGDGDEDAAPSAAEKRRQDEYERKGRMPVAADGYDWRATATTAGLSAAEIELLAKQKVLIGGGGHYRQSFELYTEHTLPVFITSDSLLNAYHGLLEDSFRVLELRRIAALRSELEQRVGAARALRKSQPSHAAEFEAGLLHAQRAIGPAMVLLGTPIDFFDLAVRSDIATEVKKIRAAAAVELPAWLGPPTADFLAVDYRRLKPVGIYAEAPLDDYFRAVRWLQIVPYRVERDAELTAIVMLADGANDYFGAQQFYKSYAWFLGEAGRHCIVDAAGMGGRDNEPWSAVLASIRDRVGRDHDAVNDDPRRAPRTGLEPYRVLPAYLLADADFFQRLGEAGEPVSGLDLAALVGSEWAVARIKAKDTPFFTSALQSGRESLELASAYGSDRESLYGRYLYTLAGLFAGPDPDAPAFMRSEAWAAKSCQTCLAGWTQMRHTAVLQAKQSILTFGAMIEPPGVIEPNPEFLRRFAELVASTHAGLDEAEAFAMNPTVKALELRRYAALVRRFERALASGETPKKIPGYEELVDSLEAHGASRDLPRNQATISCGVDLSMALYKPDRDVLPKRLEAYADLLERTAADYESGRQPLPRDLLRFETLVGRWETLQLTANRLETLVQKQLRGRPWDKADANFIKGYGDVMAEAMGYFGTSYQPRDDAPRCVEVLRMAAADTSLHAAVGRPRILYVLYPWQGMEILCAGTVMPYYEFESRERLTDDEWRAKLDSPEAPRAPDWLAPVQPVSAK